MLSPCRHGGLLELWVSSSPQQLPCNTWPLVSSPIPSISEHRVALEMAYCSHYLGSHSTARFTVISPQTRRAPGSGSKAAGIGSSWKQPMMAAQRPPNLKVTLFAWEVPKLQIAGGWASMVGKRAVVSPYAIITSP